VKVDCKPEDRGQAHLALKLLPGVLAARDDLGQVAELTVAQDDLRARVGAEVVVGVTTAVTGDLSLEAGAVDDPALTGLRADQRRPLVDELLG
jgi:hypothetical protein